MPSLHPFTFSMFFKVLLLYFFAQLQLDLSLSGEVIRLLLKYCIYCASVPSLRREPTNSLIKVTGTCSWKKLICHRLACITFPTKKLLDFYNHQSQQMASAIVQHKTNFATVHSQVTLGGCSVENEYKLLCQFTTTLGGTSCYLWLTQSQRNSLQGHMKHFCSYLGIEQNGSGWKATGYSKNGYPVTSKTHYGKLKNFSFKNASCGPAAMSYK